VLGFLSVSTNIWLGLGQFTHLFQSRAGFSECLDVEIYQMEQPSGQFQSRAGFSECLDPTVYIFTHTTIGFNPVLGFLSVSTV